MCRKRVDLIGSESVSWKGQRYKRLRGGVGCCDGDGELEVRCSHTTYDSFSALYSNSKCKN